MAAMLSWTVKAQATDRTWNGGGSASYWRTNANWGGTAPVANDRLFFGGTTRLVNTNDLTANTAFTGITFNSGAGAFVLNGNAISLSGGVTNNSTSTQTISTPISFGAAQTWNASAGNLVIGGDIDLLQLLLTTKGAGSLTINGNLVNFVGLTNNSDGAVLIAGAVAVQANPNVFTIVDGAAADDLTVSGVISGSSLKKITKEGGGTLVLSGANTFTGDTILNAGVVRIENNTALGDAVNSSSTIASGAALQLRGGISVATPFTINGSGIASDGVLRSLSGNNILSGTVILGSASSIGCDSGTLTLNGVVSGGFGLTKVGSGTLTLINNNTYTGGTILSAGTLRMGASNVFVDSGALVMNGGTFSSQGYSDTLGALTIQATSTIALGTNTGTLTFASGSYSAGTLTINNWTGTAGQSGTANRIYITASPSATFLTNITFTGYAGGAIRLGTGEIVPSGALTATKLAITSVNGGSSPTAGTAFNVVVQAQDNGGTPRNVIATTAVSLSLNTGAGILGGTLTGTILAGTSSVTINGVTYNKAESGVMLTATRTSGDNLTAGNSSPFTVLAATQTSWTGVSSTNWNGAGNWTADVPNSTMDAVIGNASFTGPYQPSVATNTAACKSLTLGTNAVVMTLSVSRALTISGNLTIGTNGALTHTAETIQLDGDLANAGSLFSSAGVIYSGTRPQILQFTAAPQFTASSSNVFNGTIAPVISSTTGLQFGRVVITNAAGVSANTNWTFLGNFEIVSGVFAGGSYTHTLDGDFASTGGLTSSGTIHFNPSVAHTYWGFGFNNTGTVIFGGTGQITLTLGATNYNTVICTNTHAAGLTPLVNWNLSGDLIIKPGATFHASTRTHTIAGNLQNDGTFAAETSTFVMSGAASKILGSSMVFSNLTVAGTVTVTNDFSLYGSFTNNGTFNGAGIAVTFNGSAASLIAGSSTTPFSSLIIAKTGGATTTLGAGISNLSSLNIASGTLDASTFGISQNGTGGTLSIAAGARLKIGGTNTLPVFNAYSFDPASTVEYGGTGSQTIAAQNYGNLTSSSTGARVLAASGTIGIAGTFTPGANSYTITGSMIQFNGAGAQTIPAFNFNHLTSSGAGARTLASSGTIGVAGTFTPGGNGYTVTGSTVNFNSAAQTVPPFTFNNLTTSGSGTKTLGGNVTVNGALNLSAGTFADGGFIATVKGNVANTATHSGAGRILLFGGSAEHSLSGGGTFNNLELDDANGAALSLTNLTVNGALTLTTGRITTATNKVIVAASGSVSRGIGYVDGLLEKNANIGSPSLTFEIGSGGTYAPATIVFANVSSAGTVLARTVGSDHPALGSSGINTNKSLNRYWSLSSSGVVFSNCNLTFDFAAGDLDAGVAVTNFVTGRYNGSTWSGVSNGTQTATTIRAVNVTALGDFASGEAPASRLTIQRQPSSSATVGATFAQQPVIRIEDALGNLVITDNSTAVAAVRNAGSGTLQGTLSAIAVNGLVSFANLSHNTANTITIDFTSAGLATVTSSNVVVSPANSVVAVGSSANPSPTGSNVTFTATVTAVAPGSGTPTGNVRFRADGATLGSPVALSNGVANVNASSLSHGTHTITAEYAGDGNFFGSTNSLTPGQLINTRPIAANDSLQRYATSGVKVRVATLLANDTDADADPLTLSSVGGTTAGGGTVVASAPWVFYTPPAGYTNADTFSYVIADVSGPQATGSVAITIIADLNPSQNVVATEDLGNGDFRVRFQGIPGRAYTIQYAEDIGTPDWQPLSTGTADATGSFEFIDTPPPASPARFYRSTYP